MTVLIVDDEILVSEALADAVRALEQINPILRGWVNYFRIGHASRCSSPSTQDRDRALPSATSRLKALPSR
jgi:Group II intron, maturase-specific domain